MDWYRIGDKPLSKSMMTHLNDVYMRHQGVRIHIAWDGVLCDEAIFSLLIDGNFGQSANTSFVLLITGCIDVTYLLIIPKVIAKWIHQVQIKI